MRYFSCVEFAGESESAIRTKKFEVSWEIETDMYLSICGGKEDTYTQKKRCNSIICEPKDDPIGEYERGSKYGEFALILVPKFQVEQKLGVPTGGRRVIVPYGNKKEYNTHGVR